MPFGSLLKKKKQKDPPAAHGDFPSKEAQSSPAEAPSRPSESIPATQTVANTLPKDSDGTVDDRVESTPATADRTTGVNQTMDPSSAASPATEKTTPRQTKGKYTLQDFRFERTLGTGSFGRVHLVQSKHNQRFYAIKVLKKQQVVKMKQVEHTNDERRMLQRVKHPFLITLWGTFQDSRNLYMVMDFIEGGELFSLLRKSQVGPNSWLRPVSASFDGRCFYIGFHHYAAPF